MKALERGNKLWEGHRIILPEYEDQLWRERKKKEEYRPPALEPEALEESCISKSFEIRAHAGSGVGLEG